MTKHIHHDLIVQWARDTTQVVQYRHSSLEIWFIEDIPCWLPDVQYRIRHKHQDLIDQKAARPELIVQIMCEEKWLSIVGPNWDSMYEYRLLEPMTKKKVKMWQWVVKHRHSTPEMTAGFYKEELDVKRNWDTDWDVIQRADWTEIEVDE